MIVGNPDNCMIGLHCSPRQGIPVGCFVYLAGWRQGTAVYRDARFHILILVVSFQREVKRAGFRHIICPRPV
ncbi:hypothetical protein Barb7_01368 [Bacteroidales bacterium Barb7]|nr:hypothetical protein Barb7_01368 [Bacteroidales bacterium Barb7]